MNLYKFNYFCNQEIHVGEMLATSSFDVISDIKRANPHATGINVWSI
jgi:hypothetical protein